MKMETSEVKNRKHSGKANKHRENVAKSDKQNERLRRSVSKEPDKDDGLLEDVVKISRGSPRISEKSDKFSANGSVKKFSDSFQNDNDIKAKHGGKEMKKKTKDEVNDGCESKSFTIEFRVDLVTILLFVAAFLTRVYKLATPKNIVFDELHYGKYVSLYMRNTFFFDQHPPLGKQLIAAVAHFTGYDGNYTFSRIGAEYAPRVPIFWLRFVPALCGSLLAPAVYKLLLEARMNRWTALLGGVLIIFDNSLLTQSRFILMESMLLLFCTVGLVFLLKFQKSKFISFRWIFYGLSSATFFTFAISVKYVGFYSFCLAFIVMCRYIWQLLPNKSVSDVQIILQTIARWFIFTLVPVTIYLGIFYIHLNILHKAGPHDSVMTSAFQASLDGGLASITKGQPLNVVHGSQITLRHTHGRTCWLHSHNHVYPVKYSDNRGSSHQQQVTCYSFKDVNNWWIVKRPERDDLVVGDQPDQIKDGDTIQLVHGITSRALNSHDVAAPMTPHGQEISCYIDYNVSMPGQLLWKVNIINKDSEGSVWHAIRSQIRLIHVSTGFALRFTGKQLGDWGFHQHEVVGDRVIEQQDTIWNVEEHRYTKRLNDVRFQNVFSSFLVIVFLTTDQFRQWAIFSFTLYSKRESKDNTLPKPVCRKTNYEKERRKNVPKSNIASFSIILTAIYIFFNNYILQQFNFYHSAEDQKERERQMLNAEMIPTRRTRLSFWEKFIELQTKMLWHTEQLQSHMYSSEPLEWPLMGKTIAYWIDKNSNAQIHLLGNLLIWYSGTLSIVIYAALLVIYMMRRRRLCYDLSPEEWSRFLSAGELFFTGYLIHYLPYFFIERTMFLHNYLPAFLFKILMLCFIVEHIDVVLKTLFQHKYVNILYRCMIVVWLLAVVLVYKTFLALSYGMTKLTAQDIVALRWKDTWDFILRKELA